MNYADKNKIFERAKKIIASDLPWNEKYNMIFSDEVSGQFSLDYYDPDMDYEDDVRAFMSALEEHMKTELIIETQINN